MIPSPNFYNKYFIGQPHPSVWSHHPLAYHSVWSGGRRLDFHTPMVRSIDRYYPSRRCNYCPQHRRNDKRAVFVLLAAALLTAFLGTSYFRGTIGSGTVCSVTVTQVATFTTVTPVTQTNTVTSSSTTTTTVVSITTSTVNSYTTISSTSIIVLTMGTVDTITTQLLIVVQEVFITCTKLNVQVNPTDVLEPTALVTVTAPQELVTAPRDSPRSFFIEPSFNANI